MDQQKETIHLHPLAPLYEYYPGDEHVIVIEANPERIAKDLQSKSVTAWSQGPIGETGYYELAKTSAQRKGEKRLVIVATVEAVEKAKAANANVTP